MMDGVRWDDIFSEWQATCGIHCEIVPSGHDLGSAQPEHQMQYT